MSRPIRKILCICTGNTCRSPMAERLLAAALRKEGGALAKIEVLSAGLAAFPGDSASPGSTLAMERVGIDLSDHASRRVSQPLVDEVDLILAMTRSHLQGLTRFFKVEDTHIHLWREFMPSAKSKEISDPIGFSHNAYESCRDDIAEAIPSIIEHLRSLL